MTRKQYLDLRALFGVDGIATVSIMYRRTSNSPIKKIKGHLYYEDSCPYFLSEDEDFDGCAPRMTPGDILLYPYAWCIGYGLDGFYCFISYFNIISISVEDTIVYSEENVTLFDLI